jgi:hypothetical protein
MSDHGCLLLTARLVTWRARIRLRRPPLRSGEFARWPREAPLLPILTAKIVSHMSGSCLLGRLRARLFC